MIDFEHEDEVVRWLSEVRKSWRRANGLQDIDEDLKAETRTTVKALKQTQGGHGGSYDDARFFEVELLEELERRITNPLDDKDKMINLIAYQAIRENIDKPNSQASTWVKTVRRDVPYFLVKPTEGNGGGNVPDEYRKLMTNVYLCILKGESVMRKQLADFGVSSSLREAITTVYGIEKAKEGKQPQEFIQLYNYGIPHTDEDAFENFRYFSEEFVRQRFAKWLKQEDYSLMDNNLGADNDIAFDSACVQYKKWREERAEGKELTALNKYKEAVSALRGSDFTNAEKLSHVHSLLEVWHEYLINNK